MRKNQTRKKKMQLEQERTIKLMFAVLDFNEENENEVREIIGKIGIQTFFANVNFLETTKVVKEKINALKDIINSSTNGESANSELDSKEALEND